MRTIAYWLTLLTILFMPWEGFLILPGIGTVSRLIGILAAGFWLLTVAYTGEFRRLGTFHILFLPFFLWNGITILWSLDPAETFARAMTYLQLAIFAIMLWDLCNTRERIHVALQAYVVGAWVPVISTIYNYFNGITFSYGRYAATGDNPNTTGILIGLGLPLAWYLAASFNQGISSRTLRWLNYMYIPIAIFAIVLTATRFALLMAVPAMLFGLSTLPRLSLRLRSLIFASLLVALYLLSSWVPQTALQRLSTIEDELQSGDLSDRTILWGIGVDLWSESPWVGIGSAAYNKAVEPIFGRPRSIHNTFVAILVELGIVGLGLFGLILLAALIHTWQHSPWDFRFWLTTLVVWLMGNLVLTWIYYKPTWLVLGLLAASANLIEREKISLDFKKLVPQTTAISPYIADRESTLTKSLAGPILPAHIARKLASSNGEIHIARQ